MTTTFAVLGIHGFGQHHLAELAGLATEGLAELVAVVDPRGADGADHVPDDVPCHPDLDTLLAEEVPDVVILATPIHTHAPLAIAAMRAGANVLVEKPTAASSAELEQMLAVAEETGAAVQVGFQSFGSHAFAEIERLRASGAIGELTGIGGVGTWLRTVSYYERSRWAGMRVLDGVPVVDGVVTNPLAHAIATALRIVGARRAEDVRSVEVELFHAHDIEADDTSCVRVTTGSGVTATFGLTLCAASQSPPELVIHGTEGELRLRYTEDVLIVPAPDGGTRQLQLGRDSLQRNLIAHLSEGTPLLSPLVETGGFMRVLDAVRTAPDPAPIAGDAVTWVGEGSQAHPVVSGIDELCERAATEHRLFSELGAPWATGAR